MGAFLLNRFWYLGGVSWQLYNAGSLLSRRSRVLLASVLLELARLANIVRRSDLALPSRRRPAGLRVLTAVCRLIFLLHLAVVRSQRVRSLRRLLLVMAEPPTRIARPNP